MRIITLASLALLGAATSGPALAGYGPTGSWTCSSKDAVVGALDVNAADYVFAKAGTDDPADGSLTISGASLQIGSGPLKDLGIDEGQYGTDPDLSPYVASGDWASRLVFSGGPAGNVTCIPRYTHS